MTEEAAHTDVAVVDETPARHPGFFRKIADGLINLTQGLGSSIKDKVESSTYTLSPIPHRVAIAAHSSSWLIRRIIDIPAEDMTSNAPRLMIDDAQISKDVTKLLKKAGCLNGFERAQRWADLFGGAVAVMVTKTGEATDDLEEPIDVTKLGKDCFSKLLVTDRWAISREATKITDPADANFGDSEFYTISYWDNGMSVVATRVHITRILKFYGDPVSPQLSSSFDGWGDSRLTSILKAVKGHETTSDNMARIVFDAVVDIIKIPNLATKVSTPKGEADLLTRLQLFNIAKGANSIGIIDGGTGSGANAVGGEDYVRNSYTFAGLKDIWECLSANVTGAGRIPLIRIFGRQSSGLNGSGDSEMTIYYEDVNRQKVKRLDPNYDRLYPVLIRSIAGKDVDFDYEHETIEVLSLTAKAAVQKQNAERDKIYEEMQAVDREVIARELLNDGVYETMTQKDVDAVEALPDMSVEEQAKLLAAENPAAPAGPSKTGDPKQKPVKPQPKPKV